MQVTVGSRQGITMGTTIVRVSDPTGNVKAVNFYVKVGTGATEGPLPADILRRKSETGIYEKDIIKDTDVDTYVDVVLEMEDGSVPPVLPRQTFAKRDLTASGVYLPLSGGTMTGNLVAGRVVVDAASPHGAIALGNSSGTGITPHIDFRFGAGAAQTYNARIINDAANRLAMQFVGGAAAGVLNVEGTIRQNGTAVSLEGHTHAYLPLAGGTLTGSLTAGGVISNGSLSARVAYSDSSGGTAVVLGNSGGTRRFALGMLNTENGSNTGGNLVLWRYSDTGSFINSVLSVNRSTGVVSFSSVPTVSNGALALASQLSAYLPLAGGAVTGAVSFATAPTVGGSAVVVASQLAAYLPLAGGTLTGALALPDATVSGALSFGAAVRQMINLWNTSYGIGVQSSTAYFRTGGGFAWYMGGAHSDAQWNAGGGSTLMSLSTGGLSVAAGVSAAGGTFTGTVTAAALSATGPVTASGATGELVVMDRGGPGRWAQYVVGNAFRWYCDGADRAILDSAGNLTVGNVTGGRGHFSRNTAGQGPQYYEAQVELMATGGGAAALGFHRHGHSALTLRHLDARHLDLYDAGGAWGTFRGAAFQTLGGTDPSFGSARLWNSDLWGSGTLHPTVGGDGSVGGGLIMLAMPHVPFRGGYGSRLRHSDNVAPTGVWDAGVMDAQSGYELRWENSMRLHVAKDGHLENYKGHHLAPVVLSSSPPGGDAAHGTLWIII